MIKVGIELFWHHLGEYYPLVLLLIFFVVQYRVSRFIKRSLHNKYRSTLGEYDDSYMMYYKKLQHVELIRFSLLVIAVVYTIATYQTGVFSVLAVAVGAVIITFQSLILSFGLYFYFLAQYRVGDTVRIGALAQGEITYIEPLYIGVLGRNDAGDHTGVFYVVPNNKAREQTVSKIKLGLQDYRKEIVRIAFDMKTSPISFEQFVHEIQLFLDGYLAMVDHSIYHHYPSYSGVAYKLDFETGERKDGRQAMYIDIGFICRLIDAPAHKKHIIVFIDHLLYHPGKEF